MEDEIKVNQTALLKDFVEGLRRTSMLNEPKLVKLSATFREQSGRIEERSMKHKTFNEDEYEDEYEI